MAKRKGAEEPEAQVSEAASNDYEGKQHYPKMKYHKDHDARIVANPEEEVALEDVVAGWQDTPIVVTPDVPAPVAPPDLPGVKA